MSNNQYESVRVGVSRYSESLATYFLTDGKRNYYLTDEQATSLNLQSRGTDYLYMFVLDNDSDIDFVVCTGTHLYEIMCSFSTDLNEIHNMAINSYKNVEPTKSWESLPMEEKFKWLDAAVSSRNIRDSAEFL